MQVVLGLRDFSRESEREAIVLAPVKSGWRFSTRKCNH